MYAVGDILTEINPTSVGNWENAFPGDLCAIQKVSPNFQWPLIRSGTWSKGLSNPVNVIIVLTQDEDKCSRLRSELSCHFIQ